MWKVYYKGKTDKYYILVLKLFFMNEETFVIISARHAVPSANRRNFQYSGYWAYQ